jgi:hypothetical protein
MKLSLGLKIGIAAYALLFLILVIANKLFAVVMPSLFGTVWFTYVAYLASKSGSERQLPVSEGGGYEYGPNMKIWETAQFKQAVICLLFTIGIVWVLIADK